MGGDTASSSASSIDGEPPSTTELQVEEIPTLRLEGESVFGEFDRDCYGSMEIKANERVIRKLYEEVFRSYDELKHRIGNLEAAKTKILGYTPGSWVENVGGMTMSDYNVPKTTTLLLIGPKGSGKSSLVNRISRVFEDDKFAPERAQVSYDSSIGQGTLFLQEYMIPRDSPSFCLYDSRSLSEDLSENSKMIKRWMKQGVCHGELVKRASDGSSLKAIMKCKARQDQVFGETKMVNFVIFVVNGLSVLKCVDSNGADTRYTNLVAEVFHSPFLSFRDHKPVLVITHGDLISLGDRARVRLYLGKLLGVHPIKQTFDIPDNHEPTTELAIVDMVRYSLEHADRNLPGKSPSAISKGCMMPLWTGFLLLLAVGMAILIVGVHGFRSSDVHKERLPKVTVKVDWKKIRHLWLGPDY